MSAEIIPFNPQPKRDQRGEIPEFPNPCVGCLCADVCGAYPDETDKAAMDAWCARCDQTAKDRGGYRGCIELAEREDGEYHPFSNGKWL